jgi:hypothetical protein
MELQELRDLKQYVLDKYQKTKDHNLKSILRYLDKIIKRKVINGTRGNNIESSEQTQFQLA